MLRGLCTLQDHRALTEASQPDVMNRLGRAMADPTRSRILLSLLDHPGCPAALADDLSLSRTNGAPPQPLQVDRSSSSSPLLVTRPLPPPPDTAGILWVAGLLLDWASLGLVTLMVHALAVGAWTFVSGSLRRLVQSRGGGRLGVGLLMLITAPSAVVLGHVDEDAAPMFLFSLAEALEDRSMDRAKQGLRALLALIPQTARMQLLDGPRTVPATEIRAGDVLLLGTGARIATEDVTESSHSWVDIYAITGEAIPVEVEPGDETHAGYVNGSLWGLTRVRGHAESSICWGSEKMNYG